MRNCPLVSILITNYNYARFLPLAVSSALEQTYPRVEVIVIDDGSTDDSLAVLAPFDDRISVITKPNGGQASAMNVGLRHSRGEIVHFLDADDVLFPTAMAEAVRAFEAAGVVKVHWPLRVVDTAGRDTGRVTPRGPLASGDLRHLLPASPEYSTPPQSGNAWARAFLDQVFPLPEDVYRTGGADTYLALQCVIDGTIAAISSPQGAYRQHPESWWTGLPVLERLRTGVARYAHACEALAARSQTRGMDADPAQWLHRSWLYRLHAFVEEICGLIPDGEPFIFVDDDSFGLPAVIGARRRFSFVDRDGAYDGPPADAAAAVRELERLRARGARYILIASPSFWWLEYYHELSEHLRSRFAPVVENANLIGFRLEPAGQLGTDTFEGSTKVVRHADL